MGVIRDSETGALRVAPLFDFDWAFGLFDHDRMLWMSRHPQFASLALAHAFSDIDASWDLSWYDPHALDGFADEVERALGGCDAIPEGYAEVAAGLFDAQLTYVNRVVQQEGRALGVHA